MFDLLLDTPSPLPQQDALFETALQAANNVLLTESLEPDRLHLPGLTALSDGEAFIEKNHLADAVQWALYYPTIFEHHPYLQTASAAALAASIESSVAPSVAPLSPADKTNLDASQKTVSDLYRQGKVVEALAELNRIPPPSDTTRSADWLTFHAGLLLAVGRFDDANLEIDLALKQDSTNRQAYALKTVIAVTQNDKAAAMAYADKATSVPQSSAVSPSISASAWLARSYAEQANFHIAEALANAHKATSVEPRNRLSWARQAELEMSAGNQKKR